MPEYTIAEILAPSPKKGHHKKGAKKAHHRLSAKHHGAKAARKVGVKAGRRRLH